MCENVEDPGVIHTGIRTGKIGLKDTGLTCSACHMSQACRFHLEDVVNNFSGRDASLSQVDTPNGVPMLAEADRRGDDLAVTVTQGQQAQSIR